jgi:hypothetical protein
VRPSPQDLLARLGVDAVGVETEELPHNRWLTSGAWHIRRGSEFLAVLKYTTAERSRGETPWDAHWTALDRQPHRWTYWCREALAYRDGLVDEYAASGITAPRALGAEVDDREAVLLLEWVDDDPGESWPVPAYGPMAEALGRAQGSYFAGRPLPAVSWLSQNFLRQYSAEKPVEWDLLDDDAAWNHPVVRETFPAELRHAATLLHRNRERLYQISEALPRSLCHLDVWPKNLFGRLGREITVIDWSFVGDGAVCEDIGNLVPDSAFDHFLSADDLPRLEQVVFDGYLRGLRAAGWSDDPRLVQLGMWSAAVKYDWLTPFTLAQVGSARQYRYGGAGEIDATFKFRERSRALLFNARWARQALELAEQLGR